MNKTFRLRLRSNFLEYRCEANTRAYNAQRNLCVSLVRDANFDNLDHTKIPDDTFQKIITPFFINKRINKEYITLPEKGVTLLNSQKP